MTGQSSGAEIAACVCLAIGVFSVSLIPFFLLVNAEHLVPRRVRESDLPERAHFAVLQARDRARLAAFDALLGLVLLVNTQNGNA